MTTQSKALQIVQAQAERDLQLRIMNLKYADFRAEFDAAPNPFVAVKEYCSAKQRKRRLAIVRPFVEADEAYQAAKGKRTTRDITAMKVSGLVIDPNKEQTQIKRQKLLRGGI